MRYMLPLALLFVLGVQTTSAQPSCLQVPGPDATGHIALTETGKMNTRPFDLTGGSYTVRWMGSAPDKLAPGNVIMTLKRADGQFFQELLVNTQVKLGEPNVSGETQVYNVKPGAHYLDVMAPAGWAVTLTPH